MVDSQGNRYLYEVNSEHGGLGFSSPQLLEYFMTRYISIFGAAIPGLIYQSKKTTVNIVFERDRRILQADPELNAEYESLVEGLQKDDYSTARWFMPLMVGARFRIHNWTIRIAYNTRRMDSVKNYTENFQDLFLITLGYIRKPAKYSLIQPKKDRKT